MSIWREDDWPQFRWDAQALLMPLAEARHKQGHLLGQMQRLGFDLQCEAELRATTEDVIKTSEIEGERLDMASVRSSVARRLERSALNQTHCAQASVERAAKQTLGLRPARGIQDLDHGEFDLTHHGLGLPDGGVLPPDRKIDGIVEMMLDALRNHATPLSSQRLFGWHAALFPTGWSGLHKITIGDWRTDSAGPMQVVSGPLYRPFKGHLHRSNAVPRVLEQFLAWFNQTPPMDGLLRSAIAHLWFVTIHPFDDAAMAALPAPSPISPWPGWRVLASASTACRPRSSGNAAITTKSWSGPSAADITAWLSWFVQCYGRAIYAAEVAAQGVLGKAEFRRRFTSEPMSVRQKTVLNRFMDGFEGNLSAKKWAAIGKCSVATAQRDINDLLDRGILVRNPGGSKRTSDSMAGMPSVTDSISASS